jgi:hypothetical protein
MRPLSGSEKSPFQLKKIFLSGSENSFFRSNTRTKLRQGCSGAIKNRPFQVRNNRLFTAKSNSFRFGKTAFSGRQDARNNFKVVLAPSKSVPFKVRKIRLFN